jgi:hypothetical protein
LLDTIEDIVCSINHGLELTAISEVDIPVFWNMLDWMALGAGGPRTSTIELALESTGLLLYLLALMLVLCRVVEAGFIVGF